MFRGVSIFLALAFTAHIASGVVPDKRYITEWIKTVYPEAVIDGNTVFIIDGFVYDDAEAGQVLDERRTQGAHISYANYICAKKVYTALHTGNGSGSGFVFIGTRLQRGKIKRRVLTQFNREPQAFSAVQTGDYRLPRRRVGGISDR